MGRRSRKRSAPAPDERVFEPSAAEVTSPPPRPPAAPLRRRARLDEAPKPPWAPFPLVELCILVGIVLIVLGFVGGGSRRAAMLFGGFALVSVAALELSIREHFSGYRSHTMLLAGVCAVLVDVPLYFTKLPQAALLGIAVAVFLLAAWGLRNAFRRRTGGMSFRV